MKTWKITLEYDGTKYSGWQEQNNARTVQGQLRKAAEDFLGAKLEIQGSGRTDSGVHAIAQVAHVRSRAKRSFPPPREILRALNERLPSDVCILDVEEESDKFHARHDAVMRSYLY
ncbi:MAG: tRNA pseudouridine(38-40) synthase TruA, partial [Bryobacteraceae bacterium]